MLLGNKQDLRHKAAVTASQAKEWAIPEGLQHIEVYAAIDLCDLCVYFNLLWTDIAKIHEPSSI